MKKLSETFVVLAIAIGGVSLIFVYFGALALAWHF